jgi:serine/threonine protein kinase
LKVDNIGFDIETGIGSVKLFDFGFARKINNTAGPIVGDNEGPDNDNNICGTPRYMAPEVLQGKGGSKKADVYSFGLVSCMNYVLSRSPFTTHLEEEGKKEIYLTTRIMCVREGDHVWS